MSQIPHTSFYLHPSRYLQATPHSLSFCDKLVWISCTLVTTANVTLTGSAYGVL